MMTVCMNDPLKRDRADGPGPRCRSYRNSAAVSTRSPAALPPSGAAGHPAPVDLGQCAPGSPLAPSIARPKEGRMPPRQPRHTGRSSTTSLPRSPTWWRRSATMRENLADLDAFGPGEMARMAQDVGLAPSDLRELARHCSDAADLLDRRLGALGLTTRRARRDRPGRTARHGAALHAVCEQGTLRPRSRRRSEPIRCGTNTARTNRR